MARTMKDSGIDWIGEIPEEWEVSPIKRVFKHLKRIVGKNADNYERLSLTMNGVLKRDKDDSDGLQPSDFETYQILFRNELVFKLIDLENIATSRVGFSPFDGLVSPAYIILSNPEQSNLFFYYYFISLYYRNIFNTMGQGVRSSLSAKELIKQPIIIPSLVEQQAIAEYLQLKCNLIDSTIERQKAVIEKLKKFKLSAISEAVTKGIDNNPSYIFTINKWVPFYPSHWKKTRIKNCCEAIVDCPHSTPSYLSEPSAYPCLRTSEVNGGKITWDTMQFVSKETYDDRTSRLIPQPGDIIYAREGGSYGDVAILPPNHKFCLGQRVMLLRPNETIFENYLLYVLMSTPVFEQSRECNTGSAAGRVNIQDVCNYVFAIPPIDEQKRIVKYLNDKCSQMDIVIANKQNLIDKLSEYKKSLIYECVTGKREVV